MRREWFIKMLRRETHEVMEDVLVKKKKNGGHGCQMGMEKREKKSRY